MAAQYYLQGNLTAPLPKEAQSLQLYATSQYTSMYRGKFPARLRSSMANSTAIYSERGHGYVLFLRVGDELMKITSATNTSAPAGNFTPVDSCQKLGVQRGLDGSATVAHERGAPVLAPAFAGGGVPAAGSVAESKWIPSYHPRYNSTYGVDHYVNWTLFAQARVLWIVARFVAPAAFRRSA